MTVAAADVWGTEVRRLIGQIYDAYATYVEYQREIMARTADWQAITAALPTNDEGGVDEGLLHALAMDYVVPRYLYLNERFWEDAPLELRVAVQQLGLSVLTGTSIPETRFHLSRTEHPVSEVARFMRYQQEKVVA